MHPAADCCSLLLSATCCGCCWQSAKLLVCSLLVLPACRLLPPVWPMCLRDTIMQVWSARVPQRHCFCGLLSCPTVGLTAVIHVNSWAPSALLLLVPLLPACWLASRPTCAYTLDTLCCRHDRCRSPPWHTHGLPWSKSCLHIGSAGTPGQGLCLPGSLLSLCLLPWERGLLATLLRIRWWLCWFLAASPLIAMPGPSVHSIHHELRDACLLLALGPLGPHRPFCFAALSDGER